MAKLKSTYFCTNCGNESPKWMGKCPACGEWGSLVEELVRKDAPSRVTDTRSFESVKSQPLPLREIRAEQEPRIDMNDEELNRVLGGGLVPASLVLIGGEPGIGKSTLVLQTMLKLGEIRTLYVSGEESARQLKRNLRNCTAKLRLFPNSRGNPFMKTPALPLIRMNLTNGTRDTWSGTG